MVPSSGYAPNELLGRLVGCRLFSVQFVLDYVQLRFDGSGPDQPVLNCDVMPTVEAAGQVVVPGGLGYADALCRFIGHEARTTQEASRRGLRIGFDDGVVVLDPEREDLAGPEIALLRGFEDGRWMCWRPGEDSFEHLG